MQAEEKENNITYSYQGTSLNKPGIGEDTYLKAV